MGQLKLGLMHEREAFGAPLASKQTIQNFIADSAAEMDAAWLMTLHAAWKMDRRAAGGAEGDRHDQVRPPTS
jgi:acyl-CoA dehydrogenase